MLVSRLQFSSFRETGHSSAWLERYTGGVEVAGSNPVAPTSLRSQQRVERRLSRRSEYEGGHASSVSGGELRLGTPLFPLTDLTK